MRYGDTSMQWIKRCFAAELRSNPEYQSAVVRLGLWLFSVVYIGLGAATDYYLVNHLYYIGFFAAFLLVFLGLAGSVVIRPDWPERRWLALVVDVAGASLAIFLTREAISPFYLLYIWLFISYGTRYGETHLKVASVLSVVAYNMVLIALDEWQRHTFEAVFFLMLLVMLPMYQYSLLRKVHEARQEAERANRAKSDFLATMTHELRTPLSGVIGMTRLLESTSLTPEQREYVHSVSTSAQLLGALIGDVLDLSKIEAKKLHLESMPFDLRQAVQEVCAACDHQSLDKGVELVCQVDRRLPELVQGDPLRLRQILFNLVGNAVKFTEQGEVVVSASLAQANEAIARPHCLLEVRDTGIGIPKDKILAIFESFWQADDSTTRRFGGTGLGTTIARDLTQLMGGVIGVDSEEGKGSRFWVRLPLLAEDFQEEALPPSGALHGRRVLIYETHPVSRAAIAEACEHLGLQWSTLERVGQLGSLTDKAGDPVDLAIIADSPAGEDLESIEALLQRLFDHPVPLLRLVYNSRVVARGGSCDHCVHKPFLARDLERHMTEILQDVPPRPVERPVQQPSRTEPETGLHILVAEDNSIAAKVLMAFLDKQGHRVTLTRDGEETLARMQAERFHMAFVDLRMPKLDGLEFTRRFRGAEQQGSHVPIIALTANAAEDVKSEALHAGMDDFLTKPVSPEELAETIARYESRQS